MPDSGTDQYTIEIKNLRTGETVILTSVDMTEQEKSVVVRQLLRLSGAPAALWIEDEEPKKPFLSGRRKRWQAWCAGVHVRKGCGGRQNRQLQS
jgi:hypothetical protein